MTLNLSLILETFLAEVEASQGTPFVRAEALQHAIAEVANCTSNRAGVRLILACLLAKIDNPRFDPRKPYTEIGTKDSFSGRHYDEAYVADFLRKYKLPCNSTTAFLTPTLRNINRPLTTKVALVGRPKEMYAQSVKVLTAVSEGTVDAASVIKEMVRLLLTIRDERNKRLASLLKDIERGKDSLQPSASDIVYLIKQHLECKNASRLPVLIVVAAYNTVEHKIGEMAKPLNAHNAADLQTGSLGDIEVCLVNEDRIVTVYEMKMKGVTIEDVNIAVDKVAQSGGQVDNYIFVTTDTISREVEEYAESMYEQLNGVEFAVLDCLGFLRHFLNFFQRHRATYLDAYQKLVLEEPDSSVSATLKETFLALRLAAETKE
jgi:hypothetical protein